MATDISLSHAEDGTPYVRLYLGRSPITGKPVRPYRAFPGMTDAEAIKAAREWAQEIAPSYAKDSQRVGDMLTRYVDHMEAQGRSYNTVKTYRLYTRRYAAQIARMPVAQVTPTVLDELFHELMTSGPKGGRPLSPSTVKKFREYLKGAFRYFVGVGLADSNPVADTMHIQAARGEAHALDAADVDALQAELAAVISGTPDTDRGIMRRNAAMGILIALYTGARVGEVCALRWRDLNQNLGMLTISGTVVERGGTPIRQDRTKGKRTRNISLDDGTLQALRGHRRWQEGYLGRLDRNTPICTVDGSHMAPSTLSEQFARYRARLGLDPLSTFHSLRHTHATMLLQAGTDMRTVQERLGHAQVSTTLETYAHVMPGRDRQAAEDFGRIMARA